MADKLPGSRFSRLVKLGWLSRRGLPIVWRRLKEASEAAPEERPALAERALARHSDIAEELFETLGELKGLALKAGQMLAYMDGAFPEEYRGVYQQILSRLLQKAPARPWSEISRVFAEDLGRPPEALFESVEPEPFAAASLG